MNRRLALGALLIVTLSAPAQAWREEPLRPSAPSMPDPAPAELLSEQMADLSLVDAVFLGLRNNRSIKSAYLWRIADKFDLRVSEDAFNPKLYLSNSYRASRGHADSQRAGQFGATATLLGEYGTVVSLGWSKYHTQANQAGWRRNDGVDFSIIQPLLRGGGRDVTTAPLRLAQLTEEANRLGLKAGISQTVAAVIFAYRELLRAQEQLDIARAALQRSQELLSVNQAMIEAGRMAEFEVVQTEASLASQELGVEEAANLVDRSRLELLRLLALDLSSPVRATDALHAEAIEIDPGEAQALEPLRKACEQAVKALPGVLSCTAVLTADSTALLPEIREALKGRPFPHLEIAGHADATGSDALNLALSRERAEAVAKVLRDGDLAQASLAISSHGKRNPLIPTADGVPEPRNRRVTVTVQ